MDIRSKLQSPDAAPLRSHVAKLVEKLLVNPDPQFLSNLESTSYDMRHGTVPAKRTRFELDSATESELRTITEVEG